MCTMANSVDPDEMPHSAACHISSGSALFVKDKIDLKRNTCLGWGGGDFSSTCRPAQEILGGKTHLSKL